MNEIMGIAPLDTKKMKGDAFLIFYNEVCARAEKIMQQTGTVTGAHYNAMRQILAELGVEVTA